MGAPLVLAAVSALLYLPTLTYAILNWDDTTYILNNPWIRSWSIQNLLHIFTKPYFANFLPLHLLSYLVDYSFWGTNPVGYHLQSVLVNALNAILALFVVRRLFRSEPLAFLAALLFAAHPSHVEPVAWISGRKDLLSTAFALASVLFYARAADGGRLRRGPYALSIVSFTLALLSKVSVVTLPLFLLLLDRAGLAGRRGVPWVRAIVGKVPYALIGLVLVGLNTAAQTKAKASYAHDALSYAMVKGHAAWNYLGLLTGALRGSPDYDLPALGSDAGSILVSILGLLVLPLGGWIAWRYGRRVTALGLGWIFITLLPALAFPLVTYMADRYLYLPSLGFCWIIASGVLALASRVRAARWRRAVAVVVAVIPLGIFVARTAQALPVWRNSDTLWSYAITRCRDFRAYTNLAEVRLEQKRWAEAEHLLRISARVDNATTYQNFAVLYFGLGRYDEALGAIQRALAILREQGWDPVQASVLYYSQGAIYSARGDTPRTVQSLEEALRENPANEPARRQLAIIRGRSGVDSGAEEPGAGRGGLP